LVVFAFAVVASGCATKTPFDYTAYKQSRPSSILLLPPINNTTEVLATNGVMATAALPLAEAGYYVLPVALVDETFKNNGLTTPNDIQDVSVTKLREIFGADAAVYMRVTQYGTKFLVFGSDTRVTVEGRIVDLRNGQTIWSGSATASSQEQEGGAQGGLVGLLVKAVVQQIAGTVSDASFRYAAIANQRLLGTGRGIANGVLAGPRSPNYLKDDVKQ
jgi:hypothetical protein